MQKRQNELNLWLTTLLGKQAFTLTPLAGDASFRRYYRLHGFKYTRVVMDAPPLQETITPFLTIGKSLTAAGVHTPYVYAFDEKKGFILLEDLGDQLLLGSLIPENVSELYGYAMNLILQIQRIPTNHPPLPAFDKAHMLQELSLFREWFLQGYLNLLLTEQESLLLNNTFHWLIDELASQPQVFIHRDFHSRNLMVNEENLEDIGVIDFQDAMIGPFTYDLVSLLKDCYIQWPREQIIEWVSAFYHRMPTPYNFTLESFTRAFDLCGLQRHLKVLGIFCRLHLRDHKARYLNDLPLTLNYVNACVESYPELQGLCHFLQERVHAPFAKKSLI